MPEERWRDTEYRGYQVSDHYQVRSRDRIVKGRNGSSRFIKGHLLTPVWHHGAWCVQLWRGGRFRRVRIERLVADAFGPTPGAAFIELLRRRG